MEYQYPTILRRYLSTFIDGLLIIIVLLVVSYVFGNNTGASAHIRVGILIFMIFIYEPLCTSLVCTVGQKITGVRVRKRFLHENISIPAAYLRIILKILLGFISFITILFTKDKRAIHDFAVGSVVIFNKPQFT
jgi:uncharacterized RDD family membrane protein YckC